jgi:hypothetical protein
MKTPIRYLDPGNGKTGLGYLWVAHRPGEDVLFESLNTGYKFDPSDGYVRTWVSAGADPSISTSGNTVKFSPSWLLLRSASVLKSTNYRFHFSCVSFARYSLL